MYTHEPPGYDCPFCALVRGGDTARSSQPDVVYRDEGATALIGALWWPNNAGHVIVVPNEHYENIYAITDEVLAHVYGVAKKIALALREAYGCEGTSTRQHNEPGANQDVWHFHVTSSLATSATTSIPRTARRGGRRRRSDCRTQRSCARTSAGSAARPRRFRRGFDTYPAQHLKQPQGCLARVGRCVESVSKVATTRPVGT